MKFLCRVGIHGRVLEGSGLMGDALMCVDCGHEKYPEVFGIAISKRQWPGMIDRSPEGRLAAWKEAAA